jgi:integrase
MLDMQVRLKHINSVTKILADGSVVTYYYARKGGPRLRGEPGTAEFVESYQEAGKQESERPKNLAGLLEKYTSSKEFDKLKSTSRATNLIHFRQIKAKLGELPTTVFGNPKTLEILEDWREQVAEHSPSNADAQWFQLSKVLSWGEKRGYVKANPCKGGGSLYNGSRVDKVWSDQEIESFITTAPSHIVIAFMLALWTGQREGSLVKLRWSAYDGQYLTVVQEKNRNGRIPKVVVIPVQREFKEFLDRIEMEAGVAGLSQGERHARHILQTAWGKPWANPASFSESFGRAVRDMHIEDRTFHDLRGTAVTRLFIAGCDVAEIATITGHSLKTVNEILDRHYFHRDIKLAERAMDKRLAYERFQLNSQPALAAE